MMRRAALLSVFGAAIFAAATLAVLYIGPHLDAYKARQVGGPFTLTDHTGKTVTDEDFRGRYMLIYFGFTYCPDICPTTLLSMTQALESMGPEADSIQPIFITIDPERDTVDVMAGYVDYFHPRLIGLTGTPDQIAAAAEAYHVYYRKVEGNSPADYTMDHSSIVYFMGRDGTYLSHYSDQTPPDEMSRDMRRFLD